MIVWIFVAALGVSVGSFLNVLIARLPQDLSILTPASHCPHCKTPLSVRHNIPLLSYIFLRGRCAFCGEPIGLAYPLVEIASCFLFLTVFAKLGIGWGALFVSLSFAMLLAMSVIDLRLKMAPDSLNLAAFAFALAASPFLPPFSFIEAINDALLLFGGFGLLRFALSWVLGREAMGEADVLVAATMGALLGLKGALFAVFLAALLSLPASIAMRRVGEQELAFVPFLAMGSLMQLLFSHQISQLVSALAG